MADAPTGEVEECIRVSGLSRIKAPRIQKILRQIRDPHSRWHPHVCLGVSSDAKRPLAVKSSAISSGGDDAHGLSVVRQTAGKGREQGKPLSLEFLRDVDVEQADRYLQSFDGVGPKTSACVLLFSFNMPIFPVDTHIHRIAIRLGLVPARSSADDVQRLLTPMIAPGDRYAMHILLIAYGRKTCHARSPKCEWCGLIDLCPHGKRVAGIQ